jgi:phosphoglycerate dehydrogenase-like enzyme
VSQKLSQKLLNKVLNKLTPKVLEKIDEHLLASANAPADIKSVAEFRAAFLRDLNDKINFLCIHAGNIDALDFKACSERVI